MTNRLLYSFFLLLIALVTQSQEFYKKDFTAYHTKEGISNNHIWSLTQDAYGYIWVATEKGLNRFDGSRFQQFYSDSSSRSLPKDLVNRLIWINKDELGATTLSGLHIINTKTLERYNLIIPADSLKQISLVNNIYDIASDKKGNLFIITRTGFYQFYEKKLVFRYDHFSKKEIEGNFKVFGWEIVLANENTLLLSTIEGLYVYNIPKKDLHPLESKDDLFFHQLAQPKEKIRFVGKGENYFCLFSLNKKEISFIDFLKRTKQLIRMPDSIRNRQYIDPTIFRLKDSLMAITVDTKGFYKIILDRQTGSWAIDSTVYFENDFCIAMMLDKNNRLWIGTINGLYKQNRLSGRIEKAMLPGEEAHLGKTISAFEVVNNKLFVATWLEGIYVFSRDSLGFQHQIIRTEKGNKLINKLIRIAGDSLMSARNAIVINAENLKHKKIDLGNNIDAGKIMGALFKTSRGSIYFTNIRSDTLYKKELVDKSFSAEKSTELKKLVDITKIAEDKEGNIWFNGNGIMRLNNQTHKFDIFLDSFPAIKTPSKYITSNLVFDNKGRLYFGLGDNGLIIYDIKENKFSQISRSDGLPDNVIRSLYLHENKTLWIATENGLANYDIDKRNVSAFGSADGMPVDPSICHTLFYDSVNKQLYADFTHSFVRFDPDKIKKNEIPPDFFVERIDITGKRSVYYPDNSIKVRYKYNNMIVNLSAINYEDAPQQLFAYRIVKNGKEPWQEIGSQRSIIFSDLSAGKHRLQVKTYIRNNSWPEQIKELAITILPPFWKTIWFYFLIALAIAGLAYYLHRRRIKTVIQKADVDKQLAQTEMKALHAQMNPHFIFNCLNSIREMILNNENEQASLYLSRFARLIRITLNQSSKPFVSLTDTIDYLERYIEMEKIRSEHFRHTIEIGKELQPDDILLPPMLIQPFIENAIWHGALSKKDLDVHISFRKKENELVCVVDDNGIGIEESLKRKEKIMTEPSVGIANIKQRIELLNEKYNLDSSIKIEDKSTLSANNGVGTIVTLHLPIKTNESLWSS